MVRGINYSVRQMFPLTDGAEYKLFGANIYPRPSWWGFLLRRNMNIQSGFYYHIKDTFFEEVQDSYSRQVARYKKCTKYPPAQTRHLSFLCRH